MSENQRKYSTITIRRQRKNWWMAVELKRTKSATINANLDLVEWFLKAYLRRLFIPVANRILRPGEFHVNYFFFFFFFFFLQHCMNVGLSSYRLDQI